MKISGNVQKIIEIKYLSKHTQLSKIVQLKKIRKEYTSRKSK